MAYKMDGGVYMVECLVNNKIYIGASNSFSRRKYAHLWSLRRGEHRNDFIQADYNMYGENAFKFTLLERVSNAEDMDEKEIKWIAELDTYNNGYNLTRGGKSWKPCGYTTSKRSLSLSGENNGMYGAVGAKNPNAKATEKTVKMCKLMLRDGLCDSEIMKFCRLSLSQFQKIKHNRSWTHISIDGV